jgi:hypothetical protein
VLVIASIAAFTATRVFGPEQLGGDAADAAIGMGDRRLPELAALAIDDPRREGERQAVLAELRRFEQARRAATDFANLPTSDRSTGANPITIIPAPGGAHALALLRGRDQIVVLDAQLREAGRLPAPSSPTGIAVRDNQVFVSGEYSPELYCYRFDERLTFIGAVRIPGTRGLRDVSIGADGWLYAVDEQRHALHVFRLTSNLELSENHAWKVAQGPIAVRRAGSFLIVNSLLAHSLSIYPCDRTGLPVVERAGRITHDGPIWSFDAEPLADGLRVAVGGVEDLPLDRTGGFFGNVDSFVFVYDVRATAGSEPGAVGINDISRLAVVNVSSRGVITPKWLDLVVDGDGGRVVVAGYGGMRMATVTWPAFDREPRVETRAVPAGIASAAALDKHWVAANPLLDAWVGVKPDRLVIRPVRDSALQTGRPVRSAAAKMGEVLFFAGLMAPAQTSTGAQSRFTCETCHFEGHVDGRTHFTGRDDVHATTKPLLGLFNNKPHFSRALDRDLTEMVNNEFEVAAAHSGGSPWFALPLAGIPWLSEFVGRVDTVSAGELRRALVEFLMIFTHRPNPSVRGRRSFTDLELRGAQAFRDRCEHCHASRLVADDGASRVPFVEWERHIFSSAGPIVWGSDAYASTGVEPYVHPSGARVPSLRRLFRKFPYFTNGSAGSLDALLGEVRMSPHAFFHLVVDEADTLRALDADTRSALRAFLDLL